MTVFKAYLKIARKNIWMILLYLGIFFGITIMFQEFAEDGIGVYSARSISVGIVDEDGGPGALSLAAYIGRTNEIVYLDPDREALQEDLFYRRVEYIVWIPDGFMDTCIQNNEELQVTTVPDTYAGYYIDRQIENYLTFARACSAAGFTESEIAEEMAGRESVTVELADFSGNAGTVPAYAYFFRYLPYLFLSVLCYVLGYILIDFRRGSLPRRMQASALPGRRQTLEGLAGAGILALALWGVSVALGFALNFTAFTESGRAGWYLLNSLVMLTAALSLAYLIGSLVHSSDALNGVTNIVALGMSFLCGVFVEMDVLSGGVRKAAQFLPVYWYESVNELLTDAASLTGSVRTDLVQGIGIQLAFTLLFVALTLAFGKEKRL